MKTELDLERAPDAKIDCLRCDSPMKDLGEVRIIGGEALMVDAGMDRLRTMALEMAVCANCGRAEFFF